MEIDVPAAGPIRRSKAVLHGHSRLPKVGDDLRPAWSGLAAALIPKLIVRVRFPSPTPPRRARSEASLPSWASPAFRAAKAEVGQFGAVDEDQAGVHAVGVVAGNRG